MIQFLSILKKARDKTSQPGMKGEHGCFVFKVIEGVGVRRWIFQNKAGVLTLEQVSVEVGMWSFYVGNETSTGIAVRNHPTDKLQDSSSAVVLRQQHVLRPMTKIFCDRKVVGANGVSFYRLQGTSYPSWVFDRRKEGMILHPEHQVQTGLFAYKALSRIAIRSIGSVGDEFKTSWAVGSNEIVVCDIVRESPYKYGNGPFLRLTDGTGWLFANKQSNPVMKEVPIEVGRWKLQVKNVAGIKLRKQPIDDTKSRYSTVYEKNNVVVCDRKIRGENPSDPSFYRVEGTDGWIFDRRDNVQMAVELSNPGVANVTKDTGGWTVEFVRGCAAAAIVGLEEISHNAHSKVISFRHPTGARINVYYTTKTIGTALAHPSKGNTQLFRRNCTKEELIEILKDPRVHTGRGYYQTPKRPRTQRNTSAHVMSQQYDDEDDVDMEEDFRQRLGDLDDEINELLEQRRRLWDSIQVHEANRTQKEEAWWQLRNTHGTVLAREKEDELRRQRTCTQCNRVFVHTAALQNHINDVHSGYTCDYCDRWFKDMNAFSQHRDATGHW
eukprot:Nitzschia sp. Nitz4//scaffold28_size193895//102752//104557//NITZ4_001663-RA/size193895-processed-gene-0.267-mRNA-1//-1//CDS//3329545976//7086//frame0